MRILKKVLKLNYAEEKGDKQVVKSYTIKNYRQYNCNN